MYIDKHDWKLHFPRFSGRKVVRLFILSRKMCFYEILTMPRADYDGTEWQAREMGNRLFFLRYLFWKINVIEKLDLIRNSRYARFTNISALCGRRSVIKFSQYQTPGAVRQCRKHASAKRDEDGRDKRNGDGEGGAREREKLENRENERNR